MSPYHVILITEFWGLPLDFVPEAEASLVLALVLALFWIPGEKSSP